MTKPLTGYEKEIAILHAEASLDAELIEEFKGVAHEYKQAIERVRELHMDSGSGQCLHCTQAETGGDEQWIEWHAVAYPCPTIQALEG